MRTSNDKTLKATQPVGLKSALCLLTISAFAIAQPIFSLLSDHGEFFIARAAQPIDVILFTIIMVALPALFMIAIHWLLGILGKEARQVGHLVLIALLFTLLSLSVVGRFGDLPGSSVLALSIAAGAVLGWIYYRSNTLRELLAYTSFAALVFPVYFVLVPDIWSIIRPETIEVTRAQDQDNTHGAIVLLIFDELPTTSLMTSDRTVDPHLFPNIAKLSERAFWFRNATTVASGTVHAVPAILSGRYPIGGQPTLRDYPDNLFTLAGEGYAYNVYESATRLCPIAQCPQQYELTFSQRLASLLTDVAVIYAHIVTPDDCSGFLPSISQGWGNFFNTAGSGNLEELFPSGWVEFVKSGAGADREATWRKFTDNIPRQGNSINVLHILLPHSPLKFLPSGKNYGTHSEAGLKGQKWQKDQWAVKQSWQRHMMQAVHVDRLIGELMNKLKQEGLFDEALIVLTADHGVSFKAGGFRRLLSQDNYMDIMPVPLFIKMPNQRRGVISDINVETVDILPTILEALGIEPTDSIEGLSVFNKQGLAARSGKRIWDHKLEKTFKYPAQLDAMYSSLDERLGLFSNSPGRDRLFAMGPERHLVGMNVTDLPVGKTEANLRLIGKEPEAGANWIAGAVSGIPSETVSAQKLALSVDSTIRAVTRTLSPEDNGARQFTFLVPESAYISPDSEIRIWAESNGIWSPLQWTIYTLIEEKGEPIAIENSDGQRYEIVPYAMRGHVDQLIAGVGSSKAVGFAVDRETDLPAEKIVLFRNGAFLTAASPTLRRKDAAQNFGKDALYSGFELSWPNSGHLPINEDYVFFGLTDDGTAGTLRFGKHTARRTEPPP